MRRRKGASVRKEHLISFHVDLEMKEQLAQLARVRYSTQSETLRNLVAMAIRQYQESK
jgi:hypothetical protein